MVLLTAALSTGCGPKMHQANVMVSLDGALQGSTSLEVDLVGVSSDDSYLRGFPVDQWFNPAPRPSPEYNTVRADTLHHTMRFSPGGEATQILEKGDAIWAEWRARGVTELMVLVDYLPAAGASGRDDPRRLLIPLESARWRGKGDEVRINVQRSRLDLATPPNPPK